MIRSRSVFFHLIKLCILSFLWCISLNSFGQRQLVHIHKIPWYVDDVGNYSLQSDVNIFEFQDLGMGFNHVVGVRPGRLVSHEYKILKSQIIHNHQLNYPDSLLKSDFVVDVNLFEITGSFELQTHIMPIRKLPDGRLEVLLEIIHTAFIEDKGVIASRNPNATYNSVLSSGDLYKIAIPTTGIYKLDKSFFETKLNINTININPKKVKLYSNKGGKLPESNAIGRIDDLEELAIFVVGEDDEKWDNNDYVLFFAEGADKLYYDENYRFEKNIYDENNYVFIKIDGKDGKRISKVNTTNIVPDRVFENYEKIQRFEEDQINLLGAYVRNHGTGQDWYGDLFNNLTKERNYISKFDFSDLRRNDTLNIQVGFAGRSNLSSTMTLNVGGRTFTRNFMSVNVNDNESIYARRDVSNHSLVLDSPLEELKISYSGNGSSLEGWLDYIQVLSVPTLTLGTKQIIFSNSISQQYARAGFKFVTSSNPTIWDITDIFNPTEMTISNDNSINFETQGQNKVFVSHTGLSSAFEPTAIGKINNQNVHSIKDEDMIIVYHPLFQSEAFRLLNHRTQFSGLKVKAFSVDEIYNEFSSGRQDPTAIRDMAKLLLYRNPDFKYILLFGDGSYDYKHLVKSLSKSSFVPAYQTVASLHPIDNFPSDDYFGLLGDNEGVNLVGGLDVSVGRLPANTLGEAKIMVDKIIHYDLSPQSLGDWKLRVGYIADDEDGDIHLKDMDGIAIKNEVKQVLHNQQKVYIDAYKQESTSGEKRYPDANRAIMNNLFNGQSVVTYMGHGGPLGWAQERILTLNDIQGMRNYDKLALFITATCTFGSYDDPGIISPAEYGMLNPNGGSIAMMTTTRPVYINLNKELTTAVHDVLMNIENGETLTFGDILTLGKNRHANVSQSFRINSRKFTLLGDPSQRLTHPKHKVVTTHINGLTANTFTDTIGALQKVSLKGIILDKNDQLLSSFNGTLSVTVYDKQQTFETLANDSRSSKVKFKAYSNILFKGTATVTKGNWEVSFWIPKTIDYSFGKARISYYASDEISEDAGGYFNDLIVGGSNAKLAAVDNDPPIIDLYLNDLNFINGGITHSNPILIVQLEDDLGINTTGNAIGQDITGVLDGDKQNIFIMNDFYTSAKDDFTKGQVNFPLRGLEPGTHHITIKAWDISGNSSEKRLDFTVVDGKSTGLNNVYNYPNPFNRKTYFQFEHDLVNTDVDILVNIYSISGKLIKSIKESRYLTGSRIVDLSWEGEDDFGSPLAKGVYLYQIKLYSDTLKTSRESEFKKMVKI